MQIRLNDRHLVHDLVRVFREVPGCLAFQTGADRVEVLLPDAADEAEERRRLTAYFETWAVQYPALRADLIYY